MKDYFNFIDKTYDDSLAFLVEKPFLIRFPLVTIAMLLWLFLEFVFPILLLVAIIIWSVKTIFQF